MICIYMYIYIIYVYFAYICSHLFADLFLVCQQIHHFSICFYVFVLIMYACFIQSCFFRFSYFLNFVFVLDMDECDWSFRSEVQQAPAAGNPIF